MSILRAVALMAVAVLCTGFIPVGGCAKGCGTAGRVASHSGDDIARVGVRSSALSAGEHVGLSGSRYADDLARTGTHYTDDIARTGVAGHLDDVTHAADDVHLTSIADDVEHSSVKLTDGEHDQVLDALKDVGEEVLGQLADGDDSDDEADEAAAAVKLESRLQKTLSREQLRKFHAEFGTSRQIVERLAREQAAKQAAGSAKK